MSQYHNPVLPKSAPDPCVLKANDGFFYVYPTCNGMRMPIYKSKNLVNWQNTGYAFPEGATQNALTDGNLWAPDVIYRNNEYLMAYALSKNGEYHDNGIGLAVSDSPIGPFHTEGLLFTSDSSGVRNSIDPSLFIDGKKLYLIWGSFNGIYLIELNYKGKKYYIKDLDKKIRIAGNDFEGAHIFKHNGFYYLFASTGTCCQGERSTYRVVVARSKKLAGPYVDKNGKPMLDNGATLVVEGNKAFAGPGHGSEIITDDNGRTWYVYHSFQRDNIKNGRQLMLDEIRWDSAGWPYISDYEPSSESKESPYFKK